MTDTKISEKNFSTLKKIYENIYKKINNQYVDVFLCGGASTKQVQSIRDRVRVKLDKFKEIRILYPEDLFAEILNMDKESNLLSLEKFLANNCDMICIICESAGSLVELGAFINNEETFDKVVAVIEKKRKRDKSFIMLGPIKMIRKSNKNNVIFYNKQDIEELSNEIKRICNIKRRAKMISNSRNEKSINTIIGIYNFIPLLLYFYKSLEISVIKNYLNYISNMDKIEIKAFETMFMSSLKLLYKDKYIIKEIIDGKISYSLTDKGYENVNHILNNARIKDKTKLYDSIRFGIMSEKYYKKSRLA